MRSPSRRQGFISLQKDCKFSLSLFTGGDLSAGLSGWETQTQADRTPWPRGRVGIKWVQIQGPLLGLLASKPLVFPLHQLLLSLAQPPINRVHGTCGH